eukprot:SAG22_NODE_440_length_10484_cov_19.751661_4_plen_468_part_00
MPEVFFSGALTAEQMDDMYKSGLGVTNCTNTGRWLCVGSPSAGTAPFTHVPFGFPHGLLQHDYVERFLLYLFTQSAHANTRGTWTTPESASIDRRHGAISFSAAGVNNIPLSIKWMLVFEEPEARTLWLAKATPRDWLLPATKEPLAVERATTRYGRISFSLAVATAAPVYTVAANVTVPASFAAAASKPAGGLVLRIRAPVEHAGKLSKVTVGGQVWSGFDAAEETVSFKASELTAELIKSGLPAIVATFGAHRAVDLRRARVNIAERVVPQPVSSRGDKPQRLLQHDTEVPPLTDVSCPGGMDTIDTFSINKTVWTACEDLQQPDGSIVLIAETGETEHFAKSYAPYGTNATDDSEYYLGIGRAAVAAATHDVLGAALLSDPLKKPITWAAVAAAVPPVRKTTIRTFTGSREAAIDFTLDDETKDCGWNGTWSRTATRDLCPFTCHLKASLFASWTTKVAQPGPW